MLLRKPKAKSHRAKRALEKRAPKVIEDGKSLCVVRTRTCNEATRSFLSCLAQLSKPDCVHLSRRDNDVRPFVDAAPLEFLCERNDCALFAVGSHSKKRPMNIVLGRTYSHRVLDMVEFGVSNYAPLRAFPGEKPGVGHKPLVLFQGSAFDATFEMRKVRNLLLDVFRGKVVDRINLAGVDRAVVVTADSGDRIMVRHYTVLLRRSGGKLPRVEIVEAGPRFDLELRRTSFADAALYREAVKVPKGAKKGKVKNISTDGLKNKLGRVHMESQDLAEVATKKFKAFKKKHRRADGDDDDEDEDEDEDDAEGGDHDDGDGGAGDDGDNDDIQEPFDFFRGGDDSDDGGAPEQKRKRARK